MRAPCLVAAALVAAPAFGAQPLISEDTGVLGRGVKELEVKYERARDGAMRETQAAVELSYGLTERADAQIELPYVRLRGEGADASGLGDVAASLKWRFYDREALSLLFKPELLLPAGRDERGLGAGRTRWAANLVAAFELARLELIGHIGYTENRNRIGERRALWHLSAAALYAATEKLKLVLDAGADTTPEPAAASPQRVLVYGVQYAVNKDFDLGIGVQRGLNDAADERTLKAGAELRWQ